MRSALTSFEAELDKLSRFLDASDAEEELFARMISWPEADRVDLADKLPTVQANSTIKRRQNYVSSIMVMYGALERFVEEAVAEYTEALMEIHQDFGKLPQAFRDQHTRLTIEYLALLKDGKVRETEDISVVIDTLHNCLNGGSPFRLNARAFSLRSSNMHLSRIRDIMRNLEVQVNGRRLLLTPSYTSYLDGAGGVPVSEMKDGEVQGNLDHIDQLVSIRNDIAHGVANLESIEESEIVRERCDKLRTFVSGLNDILICELLSFRIALEQVIPVEGDIQVFNDRIVCFHWPTGRLAPGDFLIMQPADNTLDIRHGPISTIQINNVDQDEIEGRVGLRIGVQVPYRAKFNGKFYILAANLN